MDTNPKQNPTHIQQNNKIELTGPAPIAVIGAYGPTAEAAPNSKKKFYDDLEANKAPNNHISVILGDFSAQIIQWSEQLLLKYYFGNIWNTFHQE